MISYDEQALICDLAETYQIYDYRSLPVHLVATLSVGLRNDSRIKRKMAGVTESETNVLLATIADRLGVIIYGMSNGKIDFPESIVEQFYTKQRKQDLQAFDSPEAFKKAWDRKTRGKL